MSLLTDSNARGCAQNAANAPDRNQLAGTWERDPTLRRIRASALSRLVTWYRLAQELIHVAINAVMCSTIPLIVEEIRMMQVPKQLQCCLVQGGASGGMLYVRPFGAFKSSKHLS